MKRISVITSALAALMIVLAAAGSLCSAVVTMAFDAQFYSGMSRAAVMDTLGAAGAPDEEAQVSAAIGMDEAQQTAFAQEIVSFMKGETDAQMDALSEKEYLHMLDVRGLIALAQQAAKISMTIAAGLAVVIAWTSEGKKKPVLLGMFAGVGVLLLGAAGAAFALQSGGFEAAFVRFHEIAFANDLWLMNPQTDILIRMMPQLLFERAASAVLAQALRGFVITWLLLFAAYLLVGNMIRRQLTEKKR